MLPSILDAGRGGFPRQTFLDQLRCYGAIPGFALFVVHGDSTYFAFFLGRKEPNLNHKYLVEFGELKSVFVAVCPSVLIFCGACDGFVFLSFLLNSQD